MVLKIEFNHSDSKIVDHYLKFIKFMELLLVTGKSWCYFGLRIK